MTARQIGRRNGSRAMRGFACSDSNATPGRAPPSTRVCKMPVALLPFKGMHRFIPALVKGAGFRLVEVAVNHRPRKFGQSKYGLGNRAFRATTDMFGVRWLLSRRLNYEVRRE